MEIMQTAPAFNLLRYLCPWRLAGAISDKELRVASRRRRTYLLRVAYIVLLGLYILSAWYSIMGLPKGSLSAFGMSRASIVGAHVGQSLIWFQFAAAQLVAAVLLSVSLSAESRRGTLGVLMTTPITSAHVVVGKLMTGLLQIALLPALGLPALAVLRLLGGLSWQTVLSAFCITLTASLFAAALCLWLSTYYRRSYEALSAGAVVYLVLFVAAPLAVRALTSVGVIDATAAMSVVDLANPFRALYASMPNLWRARGVAAGSFFSWPAHCLIMLGASIVIACLATRRIRHAALGPARRRTNGVRSIKRLRGSPIVWKDHPAGFFKWHRRDAVAIVVAVVLSALMILLDVWQTRQFAIYFSYLHQGLWMLVFVHLAISAGGAVAREKEGGTWALLLTTPLADGPIMRGKAVVALRRSGPLLLAALAVQTCGMLTDAGVPKGPLVMVYTLYRLASAFFVLAAGLYFGVRLRSTAVAAAATIAAFFFLNYLLAGRYNPFIVILMRKVGAVVGRFGGWFFVWYLSAMLGGALILDMVLGVFLLRRARRTMRRYVF